MATVSASFSMSLDGFVAEVDDGVTHIFDWYENGDVAFAWPGSDMVSHVTEASARELRDIVADSGAIVTGRRLFDITNGWEGHHPVGSPIFVVSHSIPAGWPRDDVAVTFTDSVESAVAQAKVVAGDKSVGVAGPNIVQQCLNLGLLDEVRVDLVPVLLGEGVPFFGNLTTGPVLFENPRVVVGDRVTHLIYKVRR